MDIALARTFLMVAETGSFIDAARKMNITQSTVSARIKVLEDLFGRAVFERSKNGAALTGAGEQFQKHALALVRVWQHAQLEVGLAGPSPRPSGRRRAGDAVGRLPAASGSPGCAATSPTSPSRPAPACPAVMIQRLLEGTLDLAVMYRAGPAARLYHRAPVRRGVRAGHQRARPPAAPERLRVRRLGARISRPSTPPPIPSSPTPASTWTWARWGSTPAGQRGVRLFPAPPRQAPRQPPAPAHPGAVAHVHLPVYMVYPEARDEEAFEPILEGLRQASKRLL